MPPPSATSCIAACAAAVPPVVAARPGAAPCTAPPRGACPRGTAHRRKKYSARRLSGCSRSSASDCLQAVARDRRACASASGNGKLPAGVVSDTGPSRRAHRRFFGVAANATPPGRPERRDRARSCDAASTPGTSRRDRAPTAAGSVRREYGTAKPRSPSARSYAAKVASVCCRLSRSAAANASASASRSVEAGGRIVQRHSGITRRVRTHPVVAIVTPALAVPTTATGRPPGAGRGCWPNITACAC